MVGPHEVAHASCYRLFAKDPGLFELAQCDVDAAAVRLVDESAALRHRLGDSAGVAENQREAFEPTLQCLDYSLLWLSDWAEEWRLADEAGTPLCWTEEAFAERGHRAVHAMLVNLLNGVVAARLLVLRGLFVQARTIVRSHGELAELAVAVLHDAQIMNAVLEPKDDFEETYHAWRAILAPRHLRRANERLYEEFGMPEEMRAYLSNVAKGDQRWLSLAAHNELITLTLGAIAVDVSQPLRGDTADQAEITVQAGEATIRTLVGQVHQFRLLFFRLLLDRHRWRGDRANVKQTWSYFRAAVLTDLWLEHLCAPESSDGAPLPNGSGQRGGTT